MTDLEFYIPIYFLILCYWTILYFVFNKFKKTPKKPYLIFSYWATCIISTGIIWFAGFIYIVNSMYSTTDYVDKNIQHSTQIFESSDDWGDYLKLYSNSTYSIYYGNTKSNGKFIKQNDTLFLKNNSKYKEGKLPVIFIPKSTCIIGYPLKNGVLDSNHYMYLSDKDSVVKTYPNT